MIMALNLRLCPGRGCSFSTEDTFCAECGTYLVVLACISCGSRLGAKVEMNWRTLYGLY